jgi:hypothetical protein
MKPGSARDGNWKRASGKGYARAILRSVREMSRSRWDKEGILTRVARLFPSDGIGVSASPARLLSSSLIDSCRRCWCQARGLLNFVVIYAWAKIWTQRLTAESGDGSCDTEGRVRQERGRRRDVWQLNDEGSQHMSRVIIGEQWHRADEDCGTSRRREPRRIIFHLGLDAIDNLSNGQSQQR